MAGGLLCLLRGNVFLYYGQEIGMVGSGDDPNERLGMLWTDEASATLPPPGVTKQEYAFPGVAAQDADPASLLNYYRAALALREAFPLIATGTTRVLPISNEVAAVLLREKGAESLLLAVNPSAEEQSFLLPTADYPQLAAQLCTDPAASVSYRDGTLRLPPWSIAVFTR